MNKKKKKRTFDLDVELEVLGIAADACVAVWDFLSKGCVSGCQYSWASSFSVPFLCFSVSLFLCFSISLFLCFSVSLFLCFSVSLFLCFSVSLFLCFSVSLFLCFSFSLSVFQISFLTAFPTTRLRLRKKKTYIRSPLAKRRDRLHDVRVLLAAHLGVLFADLGESVGVAGQEGDCQD